MQHKGIKILRKTGKIFLWVILGLLFLPLLLSALLAIPAVQNFAVDRLAGFVSRKLQTEVSIGHIDIGAAGRIHIDDFYVEDYAPRVSVINSSKHSSTESALFFLASSLNIFFNPLRVRNFGWLFDALFF